jgi:hypothetical protein
VRPEGLGKFKNHLIGYRTRDLKDTAQEIKYLLSNLKGVGSSLGWDSEYPEGFTFICCNFLCTSQASGRTAP